MSRVLAVLGVAVLAVGCRLPEREPLRPLPEGGGSFAYLELLVRARGQASAAVEAFYVDAWVDLEQAAVALEQTARFLPKTTEIPVPVRADLPAEAEKLRQDALKLGDAARARDARAVNDSLQRINLTIRQLRPTEPAPPPPKAPAPTPATKEPVKKD
jgi:hypothetical protein